MASSPRTVEEIFKDFSARRTAVVRALTQGKGSNKASFFLRTGTSTHVHKYRLNLLNLLHLLHYEEFLHLVNSTICFLPWMLEFTLSGQYVSSSQKAS
ncbi:hypothetical protein RJT34_16627 [Clitoria ternatea]|uniref:Uncharacterized protein n=1 Tax=Clitoria ternatea TaxID=43366 RepID=A0AAN9JAK5_CLITE